MGYTTIVGTFSTGYTTIDSGYFFTGFLVKRDPSSSESSKPFLAFVVGSGNSTGFVDYPPSLSPNNILSLTLLPYFKVPSIGL